MQFPFAGDARTVRRPDYLPRLKRPCFPVLKILNKDPVELVILSDHVEQVLVHTMHDGRTQPCTGVGEHCWLAHAEFATKWQGWLFVRKRWMREVMMLTLTPGSCAVAPQLLNPELNLRGLTLKVWRKQDRIRSALIASLDTQSREATNLAGVPQLIDQLGTLWSAPPRKARYKDSPPEVKAVLDSFAAVPLPIGEGRPS